MLFGSLGIGFVWGWLVGLVIDRRPRPFPNSAYAKIILPLLLATGGFMSSIYALTDLNQAIYFAAATAVAGVIHHSILHGLRTRYDT